MESMTDFILGGSKITAHGDCSHEIKRLLLLGRNTMINLDNILKSRDITLPRKVLLVKAMVFPIVLVFPVVWFFHGLQHTRLPITNSQSLLKLMSIESVMPSNHFILCHSFLLLPSIFPSIRVFSNESVHIRWPKYWSFSFSISPSNAY